MIKITNTFSIDEKHIEEHFIAASGPGGQKVNKTATAVQLRFDIDAECTLPEKVKRRLKNQAKNQVTHGNILIVEARNHRTQESNRKAARKRLAAIIREALRPEKIRKKTRPTQASRKRRLRAKKVHSRKKQLRKNPSTHE